VTINSRRKGSRGELAACKELHDRFGWDAHRTQQYSGYSDGNSPDIVCDQTPGLFWEIKRTERINVMKVLALAVKQAGRKCPVVMHRPNNSPVGWMLTLRLEDLPRLLHAYEIAISDQVPAKTFSPSDAGGGS
jgi:hypothetical protein